MVYFQAMLWKFDLIQTYWPIDALQTYGEINSYVQNMQPTESGEKSFKPLGTLESRVRCHFFTSSIFISGWNVDTILNV